VAADLTTIRERNRARGVAVRCSVITGDLMSREGNASVAELWNSPPRDLDLSQLSHAGCCYDDYISRSCPEADSFLEYTVFMRVLLSQTKHFILAFVVVVLRDSMVNEVPLKTPR
jgi:hypothetical protein